MAKPTRTINRIHFTDLHDRRFEDLCMQMVYRLHKWEQIDHDGRSGSDEGVDIRALGRLDDGSLRDWFVQCRRYQKITAKGLESAVNDTLKKVDRPPEVLLVVVACNISLTSRTAYEKYARKKGIISPYLWPASTLETKLYSDYPDLLFAFFGISLARQERTIEANVRRYLTMKRRLKRILKPPSDVPLPLIIRSIDDERYPDVDANPPMGRMSSWVHLEFHGFYHNGIEVPLRNPRMVYVIIERSSEPWWQSRWAIIDLCEEGIKWVGDGQGDEGHSYRFYDCIDETRYTVRKARSLGRIPYRNIIDCDEEGDEYYPVPHLYCRFADEGQPYEAIVYKLIDIPGELWDGFLLEPMRQFFFKDR
jgi:hypothetical protein